jgi:hypothetical protein
MLSLSCSVNGQDVATGLGNGTIYVGTDNTVDVSTTLIDSPLCGAPTSVLIGKPVTPARACTNGSGYVSLPSGTTFVRVENVYDIGSTLACAACDVNRDGIVNLKDIYAVADAFGSYVGDQKWNWLADINLDFRVNLKDYYKCSMSFGGSVNYTSLADFSVVDASFLVNGQTSVTSLDSSGCVSVPAGASTLSLSVGGSPVGAVVEFFNSTFHDVCATSSAGVASFSWTPNETASADSIRAGVGPEPYFALAWLPVRFQALMSRWSNTTNVNDQLILATFLNVVKRPIDMSVDYAPEQPTLDDTVSTSATCFDTALGGAAIGLNVTFLVYNMNGSYIYMGSSTTNSSGVATFSWSPWYYYSTYHLLAYFVLDVVCAETAFTLQAEVVPVTVDTRYPTVLEFLGGAVMSVRVGTPYSLSFRLVRADNGDPVAGRFFHLYMNETQWGKYETDGNGMFSGSWSPSQSGIYFFRACFSDYDETYRPSNDTRFVAVAQVVPTDVLFDVQPREFAPDTSMTLTATVLNASSNDPSNSPLQGYTVTFFEVDADGSKAPIGQSVTNASGVASLSWRYDSFPGVHAYIAVVGAGQQMMTSPVALTAASETTLALNVSLISDYNYNVSGYLMSGADPVIGKTLQIYVNNTLKANVTTGDPHGNFNLTLSLPSVNDQPTSYNVQASFQGDTPCNATAYGYTPNGTQYAVCTTVQYGYKPSSNCACLIVEPQAPQIITAMKTPEQIQQEAEQNGTLSVYIEWSWWYPWFRLHFIDQCNETRVIDVGVALLPFGDNGFFPDTPLKRKIDEQFTSILQPIVIGMIMGEVAVWVAGNLGPWMFAAAILSYIAYKGLTLASSWNSVEKLWESLIANFISIIISAFGGFEQFLPAAYHSIAADVANIKNMAFAFLYKCIMIPVNLFLLLTIWNRLITLGAV